MKSRILVTGGAGFIGSHTVIELATSGYEPVILDNFSNSHYSIIDGMNNILQHKITLYEGDCKDENLVEKILIQEKIEGIIHFAAYKSVGESVQEPLKYYQNNINSLIVLLQKMETTGVKNLVFSSSCTVYGQPDELPVTESSPFKPAQSPYGETKQVCEKLIKQYFDSSKDIKALSLRYFNPIGAHKSSLIGELPLGIPDNLVPYVTQTAAGIRKELVVFGDDYDTKDGTCIRDYIHVVDLAEAHVQALDYMEAIEDHRWWEAINIGTGKGTSVLEVIQAFQKATGIKLNYRIGKRRPGDVEKVYANVNKSKDVLKWRTKRSLEDAMLDAWNWQKSLPSLIKDHR